MESLEKLNYVASQQESDESPLIDCQTRSQIHRPNNNVIAACVICGADHIKVKRCQSMLTVDRVWRLLKMAKYVAKNLSSFK